MFKMFNYYRDGILGPIQTSVQNLALLNANHMRTFGVSWDSGVVRLGSGGDVYINEILMQPHFLPSFAPINICSNVGL